MKKIIVTLTLILTFTIGFSQAFVTTWNTGSDNYIVIPGYGTNYNIQWEEIGNPSHNGNQLGTNTTIVNFGTAGNYRVSISGGSPVFDRINFGKLGLNDSKKLSTVSEWGTTLWSRLDSVFMNCSRLTSLPLITPDLTGVTNLNLAFYNCSLFSSDLSNWNTSGIKSMSGTFYKATLFNSPLGNWDVSNVTNMSSMFMGASSFNQPIGNWDVSRVSNMSSMFNGASSFNQPISDWNTSSVTNMRSMFEAAGSFNSPIGNWNVSSVINMSSMFRIAQMFNQSLNNWNTSFVQDMHQMFLGADLFNQLIGNWDVSNVTNMSSMFGGASSFNQPIGNWNVSSVTTMNGMFHGAVVFNQPLNNWNTSNVTDMFFMFKNATLFNQPLNNWNTGNVTNMSSMFSGAISFNQPLGNWNVSSVTTMSSMFNEAVLFNQSLNNWNTSHVTDMNGMFSNARSFNYPVMNWNTSNVISMSYMFNNAIAFNQNIGSLNISSIKGSSVVSSIGLDSSGINTTNYDSTLIGWSSQNVQNGIRVNAMGLKYCLGKPFRDSLVLNHNWFLIGDAISSVCTLPVTLNYFTATPQQSKVLLQWQTATETNNNFFTIQRSSNKNNWQNIATIKGVGNSTVVKEYSNTDNNPLQGTNYYRIKQTDFNGRYSYSEVRQVVFGKGQVVNIYPNPAKDVVSIESKESVKEVRIIDYLGREVSKLLVNNHSGTNHLSLNINHYAKGLYTVQVKLVNGDIVNSKLIVQ